MTLRLGFSQAAAAAVALAGLSACSTHSTTEPAEAAVRVEPAVAQLAPGGAVQFSVVSVGDPVTVTQWTVVEADGGSVDADGNYRAPAAEGTYHVLPQVVGAPGAVAAAEVRVLNDGPPRTSPPDDSWVDVTRFGAVGDGQVDDTAAFANAAATGKNLWIPRPSAHYRVSAKVRVFGSVMGVDMPEIRMYGADGTEGRSIFELRDYAGPGASFTGLHLNGQWDGFSTNGEWSHLILVKGSQNVTISGNVLERPYGDCVLLGGEGDPSPSRNVVIEANQMSGPRRCDVAVIHANDVVIQDNTIAKANDYVSAIDVEPNPNGVDHVQGVAIRGNTFHTPGIAVMLYTFAGQLPNWDIEVSGNTSDQGAFFVKPLGTSPWSALRITGNTVTGGSFVRIWDMSDVTIDGNRATTSGSGFDLVSGVSGLVMTNNTWSGPGSYPVTITQSPGAQLSGNVLQGVSANVSP